MTPRKRVRRGTASSRVASSSAAAARPSLANIAALIDHGGQITQGAPDPIKCAAIANADDTCLAMLQRRPGETLQQLLERLDAAIDLAWITDEFTDEINTPLPRPSNADTWCQDGIARCDRSTIEPSAFARARPLLLQ